MGQYRNSCLFIRVLAAKSLFFSRTVFSCWVGLFLILLMSGAAFAKATEAMPESLLEVAIAAMQEITPINRSDGTYQTINLAQKLSIGFSGDGIEITPNGDQVGGLWGLRLTGYGGSGNIKPVAAAEVAVEGNRVEYRRGKITEWYVNASRGVEQGFILHEAPEGSSTNIVIQMQLKPGMTAKLDADGLGALLISGGTSLHYNGLVVNDASGKQLPARLEFQHDALLIAVNTTGAQYPIIIDPWIEQAKISGNDSTGNDWFGWSVAISGDTAVLGALRVDLPGPLVDAGAAYVFVRSGTSWIQQAKLTASDAAAGDWFGHSVAISGNTAVVGAMVANLPGGGVVSEGAAYVFVRNGTSWSQQQKLTASDAATGGFGFGNAVSISGDTAVIGAFGPSPKGGGTAYAFVRNLAGQWSEQYKFLGFGRSANTRYGNFGSAVAIDGNTAVIGAHGLPGAVTFSASVGEAYVFERSGAIWSPKAVLQPSVEVSLGGFGRTVSISGNTAVVGAPALGGGSAGAFAGAAYIFVGSGVTWPEQARLLANDSAAGDEFAGSVSISGDTVVIGAVGSDIGICGIFPCIGATYVFGRSGTTWSQQQKLTASDKNTSATHIAGAFGASVAISGGTSITGAYGVDAAYIFSSPLTTACIKSGYVERVTVKPGAQDSTIYLRTSSLASSFKTFTTTDTKLIKAAVKSLPGRTYVQIKGNADCTTATSGGAAQYVIVAP